MYDIRLYLGFEKTFIVVKYAQQDVSLEASLKLGPSLTLEGPRLRVPGPGTVRPKWGMLLASGRIVGRRPSIIISLIIQAGSTTTEYHLIAYIYAIYGTEQCHQRKCKPCEEF
jgi:hypothetical protein